MSWKIKASRRPSRCALVVLVALGSLALPADVRAAESAAAASSAERFERFWGPLYRLLDFDRLLDARRRQPPAGDATARLRHWNTIAVDTSGLDHTPVGAGENRVFGHNLGPGRSSRAMAITHIAIFDAMNAILGGYRSYTGIAGASGASVDAAIAQAAHDALAALFPSHAPRLAALLAADLASIPDGRRKTTGLEVGRRAAAAVLELRAHDGSHHGEPAMETGFIPNDHAGMWRMDPISQIPVALGAHWGKVQMFSPVKAPSRFRVAAPPAMDSLEHALAFDEVKRVGGDGVVTATERTAQQTSIGIFWAYDGTPSLCAPPRLYNQIANVIATEMGTTKAIELARLLALVNVALADAGTAIWESKYHYQVWRPVAGIREADAGSGPLGEGDGNPLTVGDPTFTPLGAPASNLLGPNFTPPFPAYPSGHAGFGGALFQTLRRFYQTDAISFKFVSDELNGVTKDNHGVARPLVSRSFKNLSEAEEENGQSRIYLGIHWAYDKQDGIAQGRLVGDHVFRTLFTPVAQRADT